MESVSGGIARSEHSPHRSKGYSTCRHRSLFKDFRKPNSDTAVYLSASGSLIKNEKITMTIIIIIILILLLGGGGGYYGYGRYGYGGGAGIGLGDHFSDSVNCVSTGFLPLTCRH
jgi:hypothetical protein